MERRQEHEGMRLWKVWESEMLEGSKGRWLVQETVLARKSKLGATAEPAGEPQGLAAEEGSCRHICTLRALGLAAS